MMQHDAWETIGIKLVELSRRAFPGHLNQTLVPRKYFATQYAVFWQGAHAPGGSSHEDVAILPTKHGFDFVDQGLGFM